jgi:hypothetical protein
VLGIHQDPQSCIPFFLVYLAVLFHTYGLAIRHAAGDYTDAQEATHVGLAGMRPAPHADAHAADPIAAEVEEEKAGEEEGHGEGLVSLEIESNDVELGSPVVWEPPLTTEDSAPLLRGGVGTTVDDAVRGASTKVLEAAAGAWDFSVRACTAAERPPHFVLVRMQGVVRRGTDGSELARQLQGALDGERARAVEAETQRIRREGSYMFGSEEGVEGTGGAADAEPPMTFGAVAPSGGSAIAAGSDLAAVGPLQLRFSRFVAPQDLPSSSSSSSSSSASNGGDTVAVLFEVIALRSTPVNTPGACTVTGWPPRAPRPAHLAADTLLRLSSLRASPTDSSFPSTTGVRVLSAEPHGAAPRDWYALGAALDLLAFVWVALFWGQVTAGNTRSLAEITNEGGAVPLGYLVALGVLFALLVLDRVAYTVGSALGKALLHCG